MPHYKILKPSYTMLCGKCEHRWNRKDAPPVVRCPRCKIKDKVESKL